MGLVLLSTQASFYIKVRANTTAWLQRYMHGKSQPGYLHNLVMTSSKVQVIP